jgi:hypothetical protein
MMHCQDLPKLSPKRSELRLKAANRVLGNHLVKHIVACALHLLGAGRRSLSQFTGLPADTLKSLVARVLSDGMPALGDRRHRLPPGRVQQPCVACLEPTVEVRESVVVIKLDEHNLIEVQRKNKVQCRTVLLTMLESGLIDTQTVADALELSPSRVRSLRAALQQGDVEAVVDHRRGQLADYRVTEAVKAEIILQYVLNVATSVPTSSSRLKQDLEERCQIRLGTRTIRLHVAALGLAGIGDALHDLLAEVKKT